MRAVKFPGLFAFLELGTAVGAVVRALKWEQRMWWDRDSRRCCSEGSVGWEVWTSVGANCCEGSEISWIICLLRVRDSSRCCIEGSEIGTDVGSEVGTAVGGVVRALR